MLRVRLESIYTETDRHGNSRRWEQRLEAEGESQEVCSLLNTLMDRVELPGVSSRNRVLDFNKYLLDT